MGQDQPWPGPIIKGILLQISLQLWQRASKKLIQLPLYLAGACCLTAIPMWGSEFQSVGPVTSSLQGTLFSSRHFCTFTLPRSHLKSMINPSINLKKIKSLNRISYFWGACHQYNEIICWKTEICLKAESTGFKSLSSAVRCILSLALSWPKWKKSSASLISAIYVLYWMLKRFLLHRGASQHKAVSKTWLWGRWLHAPHFRKWDF